MKVLILALFAFSSTTALAAPLSFICSKVSGSIIGVSYATLESPTFEFDYRIRLLAKLGKQVDTGQCNASQKFEPCYGKDMYGHPEKHPNNLAVRFLSNVALSSATKNFSIEVKTTTGSLVLQCEKNRKVIAL